MSVNTDNFKEVADVEINGQRYSITLFTMYDYINQTVINRLSKAQSLAEYFTGIAELLSERSTIPKDVLEMLPCNKLEALLLTVQGVDPEKIELGGEEDIDFAYLVGTMMSVYGCGFQEITAMPVRTFWALAAELWRFSHTANATAHDNEDSVSIQ